jgi:hypothetical protein
LEDDDELPEDENDDDEENEDDYMFEEAVSGIKHKKNADKSLLISLYCILYDRTKTALRFDLENVDHGMTNLY